MLAVNVQQATITTKRGVLQSSSTAVPGTVYLVIYSVIIFSKWHVQGSVTAFAGKEGTAQAQHEVAEKHTVFMVFGLSSVRRRESESLWYYDN